MTNDATRASEKALPKEARSAIGEVVDTINRTDCLVELINMAAESSRITGDAGNAIAWCCIHIRELLGQANKGLTTVIEEGGDA